MNENTLSVYVKLNKSTNEAVERYQALERLKGRKLLKREAASELFTNLVEEAKKLEKVS